MSENQSPIAHSELIARYLSGNASDAEVHRLEAWVMEDPNHKAQFLADKKAWMLAGIKRNDLDLNTNQEWTNLAKDLFSDPKIRTLEPAESSRSRGWWRIAAGVALLALSSIWLFNTLKSNFDLELVARNEILTSELPDGSKITLNREASLTFTDSEEDQSRQVTLIGDAFFDVARDTTRPFIITTNTLSIEVLGTSFYVDARTDQTISQVIVQSGSVAVKQGSQSVILQKNERATYDASNGTLTKQRNEDQNYLGWQTNVLNFDNTNLVDVVFALNRHFHAQVKIDNVVIENCKISATYQGKTLDAIIRIIEKSLGIASRREGDQIILTGTSCN